jgi:hypothetical protein
MYNENISDTRVLLEISANLANEYPLFEIKDDSVVIRPIGALILAAVSAYGDPSETKPEGRRYALELIDDILAAAFAGGFTQGDILRALLTRNPGRRLFAMIQAACDTAGDAAIHNVFTKVQL